MTRYALGLVLLVACEATPPPEDPPATVEQAPEPTATPQPETVHRFENNWGNGLGCTPKGEKRTLRGTILIEPFGKGSDGVLLKTADERWVLSYRAEGVMLEMKDKEVEVRGRVCDKQGAAIGGHHFDVKELVPQ